MLESELFRAAETVAPPVRADLPEAVLARLDAPRGGLLGDWRRRTAVAAAALLVGVGALSPPVRAVAANLLSLAGIELSRDEPDASRSPDRPLPDSRKSDLDHAARDATFPLRVPSLLGEPEKVVVSDRGRVVSMQWRDGTVVLDQFDGSLGAVFAKQVGGLGLGEVDLGGARGWWIPGPHDLVYVDRRGKEMTATARLAGPTLVWEGRRGVTYRLEGTDLTRSEATAIARSLTGTS